MKKPDTESLQSFEKLNKITNTGCQIQIRNCFLLDAYIRLDKFFISPFSLVSIKRGLSDSLSHWEFSETGWKFFFRTGPEVFFSGTLAVTSKNMQIATIKIDTTKTEIGSEAHHKVLLRYLKCLDTFYFMTTETSASLRLLSNPLVHEKEWSTEQDLGHS
ncbi:hypothetical protein NEDG_00413 [Nematocida displodere]|uniref:Uncharacterized protein n=1 Tax=Nematocida displodere TaxID=1805483 RepID=A0A177EJ90_9MICR|nr:hypothetical protein NEDG_00413 [Nematocida displodere]